MTQVPSSNGGGNWQNNPQFKQFKSTFQQDAQADGLNVNLKQVFQQVHSDKSNGQGFQTNFTNVLTQDGFTPSQANGLFGMLPQRQNQ